MKTDKCILMDSVPFKYVSSSTKVKQTKCVCDFHAITAGHYIGLVVWGHGGGFVPLDIQ